mmetsp:Transcript_34495/g.52787  ORF Transcript_34495/g.52787 Transcript_34495/m.52787 type:complete len:261 (-) Transcript_34495:1779-2561(-)
MILLPRRRVKPRESGGLNSLVDAFPVLGDDVQISLLKVLVSQLLLLCNRLLASTKILLPSVAVHWLILWEVLTLEVLNWMASSASVMLDSSSISTLVLLTILCISIRWRSKSWLCLLMHSIILNFFLRPLLNLLSRLLGYVNQLDGFASLVVEDEVWVACVLRILMLFNKAKFFEALVDIVLEPVPHPRYDTKAFSFIVLIILHVLDYDLVVLLVVLVAVGHVAVNWLVHLLRYSSSLRRQVLRLVQDLSELVVRVVSVY